VLGRSRERPSAATVVDKREATHCYFARAGAREIARAVDAGSLFGGELLELLG
jgi:hypothetical protein